MAETNAETPAGSESPADNPRGWIKARIERDAEPTSSTGQSDTQASPAQPNVAESPAPVQPTSWRDTVIGDDVDHGFFKGKKVADAIESYKHAERAKQDAERRANDLQRQLESERIERQAELAARKVAAEQQRKPEVAPDPYAEIERDWFENPKAAAAKLREQTLAEAQRLYDEREKATREAWESEQRAFQTRQTATEGERVFYAVRDHLGVDAETWERRGIALLSTVTRQGSDYANNGGPLNPQVLVQAYKDLWPDAPAVQVNVPAAPVAPIATPPGANKPARASMPSNAPSPLSAEKRALAQKLANAGGFDPQVLIKKWQGEGRA